jgi:hypothetical protein
MKFALAYDNRWKDHSSLAFQSGVEDNYWWMCFNTHQHAEQRLTTWG